MFQEESTSIVASDSKVSEQSIAGKQMQTNSGHIVSGRQAKNIRHKFRLHIFALILKHLGLTKKSLSVLRTLTEVMEKVYGKQVFSKWVQAGGKYFYFLYSPAFPSRRIDEVLLEEISRIEPLEIKPRPLRFAFFAITKKCPLHCEHCFEWDNIHKKEVLSYENLRSVVLNLLDAGITQLHLSGGEPMLRVKDIVKLSQEFSDRLEIWVLTSGFNATGENILQLKSAGVTGMVVSLDHFDSEKHDAFRRHPGSFDLATNAIRLARKADMPVAASLCVTRDFCTRENMEQYLNLVHSLDVSFVQLLEPRAVGGYAGREVALEPHHLNLLSEIYEEVNFSEHYETYPIVVYHGYYQRKVGCFSAGNRALYVDTGGNVTACPFCQAHAGNLLQQPVAEVISKLREKGCSSFGSSII
jgi:MoaA/NifB/PqqE/SkfB family radical SAM enzyme